MAQDYTPDCYGASHLAQTDLANMEKNHECHRTNFSGADLPANPVAGMWWLDTANHILKQRNDPNDAWIPWFDLSAGKLVASAAPNADEKVKAVSGDSAAGYLDAKVDNSTIEVFANVLRVKTGGLNGLQCAAIAAGNDLFLEAPAERYTAAETYTIDKPYTFFYIDPPYYGFEDYYGPGIYVREDFEKLRDLRGSLKGKFILSINDREETRESIRASGSRK